ncbi:hypothetical protein IJ556_06590, partial [bacterium]|nr:hypothetical protein [bacterium]
RYKEKLNGIEHRLEGVSVESVLKRGFAWVKDENERTIYNTKQAEKTDKLIIRFADGEISTNTTIKQNAKKIKKEEKTQETLFDF